MRISTGEGWTKLLYACSLDFSDKFQCTNTPTFDDYKNNGCNYLDFLMFV